MTEVLAVFGPGALRRPVPHVPAPQPGLGRGVRLYGRAHIDLQRVAGALCCA